MLLALAVLWGASFMFIKVGVREIPPPTFVCLRFVIAASIIPMTVSHRRTHRRYEREPLAPPEMLWPASAAWAAIAPFVGLPNADPTSERAKTAPSRRELPSLLTMDVYPSLTYRDLEAALDFLEKGFGLQPEDVGTDEHGAIRHAVLKHGEPDW